MRNRTVSVQADSLSSTLSSKKRHRCYFGPSDDQKLRACRSHSELLEAIAAIVRDSNYSRRSVVRHAKELGVWEKFQTPRSDAVSMARLLSNSASRDDALDAIAAKLSITRQAARRRVYRDDHCVESLVGGTYSVREAAEGLCMSRSTVSALVRSGVLRAKRLQRTGKLRICSDAIINFVLEHPRQIPWSRCLERSPWLRDILESTRYQQVAGILCISPKTLRSWIERGILHLKFDPDNIQDLFSDEPLYRILDEYPELINIPRCIAGNPEWFHRYGTFQGRYPKRSLTADKSKAALTASPSFRILLRRG